MKFIILVLIIKLCLGTLKSSSAGSNQNYGSGKSKLASLDFKTRGSPPSLELLHMAVSMKIQYPR